MGYMESFQKKLQELRDLLKATAKSKPQSMHPDLPKIPEIKPVQASSMSGGAKPTKMPGINPGSKKDPVKVAQQLKQGKPQKHAMPKLEFSKSGQWSLNEEVEKASFRNIKPEPKDKQPLRFPDKPANHPFNRIKDSDIKPFDPAHVDITHKMPKK